MADYNDKPFSFYDDAIEHSKVMNKLNNIDNVSEAKEKVRDFAIDVGTGAALGSLGGFLTGKFSGIKNKALDNLKNGKDTTLGSQARIVAKSEKRTPELVQAMQENKNVAQKFIGQEISPKKALGTVIKNDKLEADVGPNYVKDISSILQRDTGKSDKEINKIFQKYLKDNENSISPVKLLEAKDKTVYAHSIRVAKLTKKVAMESGMSEPDAERLAAAALLHDFGKLVTPSRVLDSTMTFKEAPELQTWMRDHPNLGGMMLASVDPLASKVAYGHHIYGKPTGSKEEKLVTIADIYDAVTSPRSYKSSRSADFALNNKEGIRYNINKGETTDEYLDLLKSLKDQGKLDEWYDVESELEDVFPALKANAIKREVGNEYGKAGALNGFIFGANLGAIPNALNADKGGLGLQDSRMAIPTASEILKDFFPSMRSRKEKLQDIKAMYINEFSKNPEVRKIILNTDFSSNKSVTETWKKLSKMSKD